MAEEIKNDGGARIAARDAATKVHGKTTFQKAMVANGWFMPSDTSQLCTTTFMSEMRSGECYGFKLKDVTFMQCAYPPTNETLRNSII